MKTDNAIRRQISDWEQAFDSREDLRILEIKLRGNKVTEVLGEITTPNGSVKSAKWDEAGHCFYRGRRVKEYDIVFEK